MKSKQSCYECIYRDNHNETEDFEICGKINQITIDWALNNAPQQTIDRFRQSGEKLLVGNDIQVYSGPVKANLEMFFVR